MNIIWQPSRVWKTKVVFKAMSGGMNKRNKKSVRTGDELLYLQHLQLDRITFL